MSLRPDMAKAVLRLALGVVALAALTLVIHNYAFNLLPYVYDVVDPGAIKADPGSRLTWITPFSASEPDRLYDGRSRTRIFEDGAMLAGPPGATAVARTVGGGNWSHDPGVIVFSSSDGSDPRTNSRAYALSYPVLYGRAVGRAALAALVASALGLAWLTRRDSPTVPPAPAAGSHWNRHLVGASLLFLAGLYCCTGSLTPYAITTIPHAAKASTYLYNPDHIHFQALFNFVDGRDRSTWDHALLLRRILYNVLAYPFMKLGGWEVGGTIASLTFNLAAFVAFVLGVRRRVGERGAILAAWLLALYPGAGYWAGLPYLYALIVPVSLVLMVVLAELAERPSWRAMLLCSAALGVANLGYEFFIFFLPASVLVLLGRRRWLAALVSPVIQALPLGLWLFLLQHHFGQDLANSNSSSFGAIAGSYLHVRDPARWLEIIAASPETGMEVFFGANFLFLPLLFLVVAFVNAGTSRVRPGLPEAALLAAGLGFFLFANLAPDYVAQWQLRGPWISRLYQPVLPALLWFIARWYQHLPPLARLARVGIFAVLGLAQAGNALVLFGPILDNPGTISEVAFYRFYDHAPHVLYPSNLKQYGRRPLGFPLRPKQP